MHIYTFEFCILNFEFCFFIFLFYIKIKPGLNIILASKMVVKTKKLNKQRNKHLNKYTSTKKTVFRRTRKNDLVLRGGGDDVEIYYKKPGLLTFGKIEGSTDSKTGLQPIKSKQLYELPYFKFKTVGSYKFILEIKNYIDVSKKNTYGQQQTSTFVPFTEYKVKHNKLLSNEKSGGNINNSILDSYIKKYKQISIHIKVYKTEKIDKTEKEKYIKDIYFNLEPKD